MKKRILLGIATAGTALAMIPMFAAFEAHVINVTATIENALNVPISEIEFGTVFPQEALDQTFEVFLSQSFLDEDRVDDVDYFIRQKPKCADNLESPTQFGVVTEDGEGNFECVDENFVMLPLLCPYLSKHEISADGTAPNGENDGEGLNAFHGPIDLVSWTLSVAQSFDVDGHLAKSQDDENDTWNINLKVPCFFGQCAQDWADFVEEHGEEGADPDEYIQPIENEHALFGCDLWLEVGGVSTSTNGIGCLEQADVMLVLDRSGSIDDDGLDLPDEMDILKDAANGFITALQLDGVHAGMVSFSDTANLDVPLTNVEATLTAAINALTAGGLTNLEDALLEATAELAGVNDRPDGTAPDFIVLITDGAPTASNDGNTFSDDAIAAATAAKAAGIEIFVVGVGTDGATATFLEDNIASTDPPEHYFDSADFSGLETLLTQLAQCEE